MNEPRGTQQTGATLERDAVAPATPTRPGPPEPDSDSDSIEPVTAPPAMAEPGSDATSWWEEGGAVAPVTPPYPPAEPPSLARNVRVLAVVMALVVVVIVVAVLGATLFLGALRDSITGAAG
ncbi:hypothetical protein SAMN05444365_10232 [Micromonospora pattaloongensis]|uniref:Uncharacterized protein n=1 Tax=Micromonospora pattaloongensis TaxID=405436 RepID=A0A1H3JC01_9ACTN|nr:hypothetical protein [Micromonospora pattaloongensis]SDY37109.1 hypothetical protein SAMN05444365_10232 [Micromonospora pattaloongensis]